MKIKKNKEKPSLSLYQVIVICILFLIAAGIFVLANEVYKNSKHNHYVKTNIEVNVKENADGYTVEVVTPEPTYEPTPEPTIDYDSEVAEGSIHGIYITQGTASKYNKLKKIGTRLINENHPNVQEKEGVVMLKNFEELVSFIKEVNKGKCCYGVQAEQFYEKDGKYILQYRVHIYEKKRKPSKKNDLMHYYTYRIFKFDTIKDYWKMKQDYPSFGIYQKVAWDSKIKKYVVIGYNEFRYWEKEHNKYVGGVE